jgi:hypothetical protein
MGFPLGWLRPDSRGGDKNTQAETKREHWMSISILTSVVLVLVVLGQTLLFSDMRLIAGDDAYITYRYARNIARGVGMVYNPGEPVLATTTPLFAFILALFSAAGADLILASTWLGLVGLAIASVLVFAWSARYGYVGVGIVGGLLLGTSSLALSQLGMEAPFYLALIAGTFTAYAFDHIATAGLLAGLCFLTRGDGVLVAAVLGMDYLWRWRRFPWRVIIGFAIPVIPWLLYAQATFGSPLPATLHAKVLQGTSGVWAEHFEFGLIRFVAQPYMWLMPWLALGLLLVLLHERRWLPVVLWAVLYIGGYIYLQVPYHGWYYVPLLIPMAILSAFALCMPLYSVDSDNPFARRWNVVSWLLWIGALVLSLILLNRQLTARMTFFLPISLFMIAIAIAITFWFRWRALAPVMVQVVVSVLLVLPFISYQAFKTTQLADSVPTRRTALYLKTGEWLQANVPPTATLGMPEIGIMGYLADGPVIDLVGLLQPAIAKRVGQRDLLYAIREYEPDYLILLRGLFSEESRPEWFNAAYKPVRQFSHGGLQHSIYQRVVSPLTEAHDELSVVFDDTVELFEYQITSTRVAAGDQLETTLYLRLLKPIERDSHLVVQLIGPNGMLVAQQDDPLLAESWDVGKILWRNYRFQLPSAALPSDNYVLRLGLYDVETASFLPYSFADAVSATDMAYLPDPISVLGTESVPGFSLLPLDACFDGNLCLTGIAFGPHSLSPGDALHVALRWRAGEPVPLDYAVFLHMLSASGELRAQRDQQYPTSVWPVGQPTLDLFTMYLPEDLAPGDYSLVLGLYDPRTGQRLKVDEQDKLALSPGLRVIP